LIRPSPAIARLIGAARASQLDGVSRSDCGAIELRRNLLGLGGLQPHNAHVVHVGDDGGNGAALAVGWLSGPDFRRKIFDQILVDAVVGAEGVYQGRRKLIDIRAGRSAGACCIRSFGHFLLSRRTWQGVQFGISWAHLQGRLFNAIPVNLGLDYKLNIGGLTR
jgi:hypothetical protein